MKNFVNLRNKKMDFKLHFLVCTILPHVKHITIPQGKGIFNIPKITKSQKLYTLK